MKQLNNNLMYIFKKAEKDAKKCKCYVQLQAVNNFESIEKCGDYAIKISYIDDNELHYAYYSLENGWY